MSNPKVIVINIDNDVEANDMEPAENDHITSFIPAISFAKVIDILLLLVAAICGLMETLSRWADYFPPAVFGNEAELLPRSTLGFLITALTAFVEIKSQGQTGFPFQTHPQVIRVSVTSLLIYGLASMVEHAITTSENQVVEDSE